MPLPNDRPFNEAYLCESTTSIATTPVPAMAVAPVSGLLQRVAAAAGGTTTGTINVTVSINGGPDIAGGQLNIPAGVSPRPGTVVELPLVGAGVTSGVFVSEGDAIVFTPSGGASSTSITGAFAAVIRAI
jgi:hypothetical protein